MHTIEKMLDFTFRNTFYGLGMNPRVIGIDKINTMMKNQRKGDLALGN